MEWLGRQRTRAVAALVIVGIAVPPIGAVLKPFVTEAVFVLLCLAFIRLDTAALRNHLKRPGPALAATLWTAFVVPVGFAVCCVLLGVHADSPDLFLALMLQAVASPMMAAPAFAALMGLDATLVLITLVASTALTPLTAPIFAAAMGLKLTLSPLSLGLNLFAILAGSATVAFIVRRIASKSAVVRHKDEIDGLNILVLFVFVAAVMESVGARFVANPVLMLALTALAFLVFFAVLGLTALCFAWAGRERALTLGFMASQRNMGLMLAATGGSLPDLAWQYFAVSQLPIYLSPQLLKPLARRVVGRPPAGDRGGPDSK